jgi:HSP20 family protein
VIREWGRSIGTTVFETVGRAVSQAQERKPLPVDLLESDDAYLAVFDAPGTSASDLQVRFDGGRIEVRIDRFREFHEGFDMVFPGRGLSLDGHVTLPEDAVVDPQGAEATLKDVGELHVRVPKVEAAEDAGDEGLETGAEEGTEREAEATDERGATEGDGGDADEGDENASS